MLVCLLRRVFISVPVLFAVLLASFLLLHALPGDLTHALLGIKQTPLAAERIREREGLDNLVYVQYASHLLDVVRPGRP